MSTLTNSFPEKATVNGVEYPIHADFRTVLRCFEIQGRKPELSEDDLLGMLKLFYNVNRLNATEEHIDRMFWFFSCGREEEKKKFPRKIAGINDKQPFDFEEDADLIYAGFMQQYGIDLQNSDMHWWKFMILLENLGSDTRLNRVIEYRTIDTANRNLSKQEREFYRAMQRYYGLDVKAQQHVSERVKQIEAALMRGEDVSSLLE